MYNRVRNEREMEETEAIKANNTIVFKERGNERKQ